MSQHKVLTNLEKGKLLRAARKRLSWTQEQMGDALNLDSTYVSQLENGHRPVDDFYLEKVAELEKVNKVNPGSLKEDAPLYGIKATTEDCRDYFDRFLTTCDDAAKIGWTAVELREHFPLTKWGPVNSSGHQVALKAAKLAVDNIKKIS